ncbi:hypothetical protein CCACVL1_26445 [Corchorus capsularis]|uniref:Uncharacterized protein n=1 Tax=Corchorus capsularis TaxID=210143 RepID=A0A1R3GES0_COCAP|nr:hypothetical protein CCACVL1_26445 [Corchorus capsularis]
MGVDNLLITLKAKSLQQFVATNVIENALLKLIKDGPVNPSWGPPNSYLFLGLHGHSKAHLGNYINENLETDDGVPLLVDIDLSDFSNDGALLRLKNKLPRFVGDEQLGCSTQFVGDMKVRPYIIIFFNHVEKVYISTFST